MARSLFQKPRRLGFVGRYEPFEDAEPVWRSPPKPWRAPTLIRYALKGALILFFTGVGIFVGFIGAMLIEALTGR